MVGTVQRQAVSVLEYKLFQLNLVVMGILTQNVFIRGLHVYKVNMQPGDNLTCQLDMFWMSENPGRYSVAVYNRYNRKVCS